MKIPAQFGGQEIITTDNDIDGILTRVSSKVTDGDFDETALILKGVHSYVKSNKKIAGIALPQLGISKRGFVIWSKDKSGKLCDIIAINPSILYQSETAQYEDEECLSEPGVKKKMKRSRCIEVSYFQTNRVEVRKQLTGKSARIFLHEYDHLDGVLLSSS